MLIIYFLATFYLGYFQNPKKNVAIPKKNVANPKKNVANPKKNVANPKKNVAISIGNILVRRQIFFEMWPPTFFDYFKVFWYGEYDATVKKFRKVDFFRCKPDLSTRNGLRPESKNIFLDKLTSDWYN